MITGIGLDVVESGRIETLRKRQPRFPERVLTQSELEVFGTLGESRKTEFLAGRFAAKEAYAKAYGTGIGRSLSFQDIEVGWNDRGKPEISGPAPGRAHLSITHTEAYAAAQVIIEE